MSYFYYMCIICHRYRIVQMVLSLFIHCETYIIIVKELVEENKHLEGGMKEILQAIKEMQKGPDVNGGETSLIIPSLERLVNVSYVFILMGSFCCFINFNDIVNCLTSLYSF